MQILRNKSLVDLRTLDTEATNQVAGATGAKTINKLSGRVRLAAGQTTLVVTNNKVGLNSHVYAVVQTDDATAYVKNVVPAAGSFTITMGAAVTAETAVAFLVIGNKL